LFIALTFASPLSDAGGTIGLLTIGGEGFCLDSQCARGDYRRYFSGGSVVGVSVPVPEPSALALLALGAAALPFAWRKSRRLPIRSATS
jgi:hypothetical protein